MFQRKIIFVGGLEFIEAYVAASAMEGKTKANALRRVYKNVRVRKELRIDPYSGFRKRFWVIYVR